MSASAPSVASGDNGFTGEVDVLIEAGNWPSEARLVGLVRRCLNTATAETAPPLGPDAEISIVFTDDDRVRKLNFDWRGQDKPTNVLSFPAGPGRPGLLGDIVLSAETVAREAELEGKTLEHHIAHLVIHGFLHLLGHDHDDDADADAMESIERRALARLGIADPYSQQNG